MTLTLAHNTASTFLASLPWRLGFPLVLCSASDGSIWPVAASTGWQHGALAPPVPAHQLLSPSLALLAAGWRLPRTCSVAVTSIFLVGQIPWVYRAPLDPVAVSSPVAGEWL